MATGNLQWIDVIGRLIKLTKDRKLIWEVGQPLYSIGQENEERIESIFYTTYKDKKIRIYKRTYKAYRTPHSIPGFSRPPRSYIESEIVLEFVNDDGLTLWRFPQLDMTRDLLSSIQYQVAKVGKFLADILNENV